jgi:hypothetical protein
MYCRVSIGENHLKLAALPSASAQLPGPDLRGRDPDIRADGISPHKPPQARGSIVHPTSSAGQVAEYRPTPQPLLVTMFR